MIDDDVDDDDDDEVFISKRDLDSRDKKNIGRLPDAQKSEL